MTKPYLPLILLAFAACAESPSSPLSESMPEKEGAELLTKATISIKNGETVTDPSTGLSISLNNVNDSRCPGDAICITAGEASTEFSLNFKDSEDPGTTINLCLDCREINDSTEVELKSQRFLMVLKNVTPYPFSSQPATLKNKVAELHIQPVE